MVQTEGKRVQIVQGMCVQKYKDIRYLTVIGQLKSRFGFCKMGTSYVIVAKNKIISN